MSIFEITLKVAGAIGALKAARQQAVTNGFANMVAYYDRAIADAEAALAGLKGLPL